MNRHLAIIVAATTTLFLTQPPARADLGDSLGKLIPDFSLSGDSFGGAVVVDGSVALIGAAGRFFSTGTAFLFDVTTGTQLLELMAPTGVGSFDRFGSAVALSDSYALVSAVSADGAQSNSGTVFAFDPSDGTQLMEMFPIDGASGDLFGISIGLDGTNVLIGSVLDDDLGVDSGSAYLFSLSSGLEIAKFTDPGGKAFDKFGSSVALSGQTAVIGAPGNGAGSASLFDLTTGSKIFELDRQNGQPGDGFGSAVAIEGSLVVVGATMNLNGGSGGAYVFDANSGMQIAELVASDTVAGDAFGTSVALDGGTILVGAPEKSNGGVVYVFDAVSGLQLGKLVASDVSIGDQFGESISITGAVALVGSSQDDDFGLGSGSAYLLDSTNPAVPASSTLRNGSGVNAQSFQIVSNPVIGDFWDTDVDASGHAFSPVAIAVYEQSSAGIILPAGELLVDVTGDLQLSALALHMGNVVRFSLAVPPDVSLFGLSLASQAVILGSPGAELTNAIDLVIGN